MSQENRQNKKDRAKELILEGHKNEDIRNKLLDEFGKSMSYRDITSIRKQLKEGNSGLTIEMRKSIGSLINLFLILMKSNPQELKKHLTKDIVNSVKILQGVML